MVLLSPTLWRYSMKFDIEEHVDFWYDSLNDCYTNCMTVDMICTYVEAINDYEMEATW